MRSLFALLAAAVVVAPVHAENLDANPSNLMSKIGRAHAGDTVRLAPGAYGVLNLSNLDFAQPVTITGEGAVFKGLNLQNVQGLTLAGLEFSASCGTGFNPLIAYGSKNLRFEGLNIHGDNNCWAGLLIRESSQVVVTRSEFHHLGVGLSRLNAAHVDIIDNSFHDIASDGVNGGGGSFINIIGNRFTDFRPSNGAHPDAIQVWTTRTKDVTTDIVISGNVYTRGPGGISTVAQGIFVTADSNAGEPRLARVKITGNVLLGGMFNGITVQGVDGAEISGNTVAGFPDMESWIRAQDNTGLVIRGNRSQNYIYPKGKDGLTESGNKDLDAVRDGGAGIVAALAKASHTH
jgi:hypothetical protein